MRLRFGQGLLEGEGGEEVAHGGNCFSVSVRGERASEARQSQAKSALPKGSSPPGPWFGRFGSFLAFDLAAAAVVPAPHLPPPTRDTAAGLPVPSNLPPPTSHLTMQATC